MRAMTTTRSGRRPEAARANAARRTARRASMTLAFLLGLASGAAAGDTACRGPACPGPAADGREAPCRIGDPSDAQPHRQFDAGCLARRSFAAPASRDRCAPGSPACAAPDAAAKSGNEAGATVSLPAIDVVGSRESPDERLPTLEERFASTLDRGNPEVAGGKIRHGAFYALGMYWGSDPLTFLYLNLR